MLLYHALSKPPVAHTPSCCFSFLCFLAQYSNFLFQLFISLLSYLLIKRQKTSAFGGQKCNGGISGVPIRDPCHRHQFFTHQIKCKYSKFTNLCSVTQNNITICVYKHENNRFSSHSFFTDL